MSRKKSEEVRLARHLVDAITGVCRSSLAYKQDFQVEGLLGITVDRERVILVNVSDVMHKNAALHSPVSDLSMQDTPLDLQVPSAKRKRTEEYISSEKNAAEQNENNNIDPTEKKEQFKSEQNKFSSPAFETPKIQVSKDRYFYDLNLMNNNNVNFNDLNTPMADLLTAQCLPSQYSATNQVLSQQKMDTHHSQFQMYVAADSSVLKARLLIPQEGMSTASSTQKSVSQKTGDKNTQKDDVVKNTTISESSKVEGRVKPSDVLSEYGSNVMVLLPRSLPSSPAPEVQDRVQDKVQDREQDREQDRVQDKVQDREQDKVQDKVHERVQDKTQDKTQDKVHGRAQDRTQDSSKATGSKEENAAIPEAATAGNSTAKPTRRPRKRKSQKRQLISLSDENNDLKQEEIAKNEEDVQFKMEKIGDSYAIQVIDNDNERGAVSNGSGGTEGVDSAAIPQDETDDAGEGTSQIKMEETGVEPISFKDPYTGRTRRIFECPKCNKVMQSGWKLRRHMSSHTGKKPYECEVCNKQFVESALLKRHLRTHSGEKPFRCEICCRVFTDSGNLKKHVKIHTSGKPFECYMCGEGFYNVDDLYSHLGSHTGEKPFECSQCGKMFSQAGHLTIHKIHYKH